jgi:hypothetical protein
VAQDRRDTPGRTSAPDRYPPDDDGSAGAWASITADDAGGDSAAAELAAMNTAYAALRCLRSDELLRVLRWLNDRLTTEQPNVLRKPNEQPATTEHGQR